MIRVIHPRLLHKTGWEGCHDAFAVIRETIRDMEKVAIGRMVLTNRQHIIALVSMDKGLVGTLLRHPYEVRSADEYFDEIQDVKIATDMLDLARHIVNQKSNRFGNLKINMSQPALVELINEKRQPITPKSSPSANNVLI